MVQSTRQQQERLDARLAIGRLADVHRTLAFASKCAEFAWYGPTKGGGSVMPRSSPIKHKIQEIISEVAPRHGTTDGSGVYTFDFKMKTSQRKPSV